MKVTVMYTDVFRASSSISVQVFEKVLNGFKTLTIFKNSTLDV